MKDYVCNRCSSVRCLCRILSSIRLSPVQLLIFWDDPEFDDTEDIGGGWAPDELESHGSW